MREEWKKIKDFPDYEVSNLGRIRSVDRYKPYAHGLRLVKGQILKPRPNVKRGGYMYIVLSKQSHHYGFKVHRLVAEAFIPNPEHKPQVNHIDCDVANNKSDNLEWVTPKENMQWMIACGRQVKPKEKALIATNIKTGEQLYFKSSIEAVHNGFHRGSIWRCMTGEYSHHHGYKWEFAK